MQTSEEARRPAAYTTEDKYEKGKLRMSLMKTILAATIKCVNICHPCEKST